MIRGVNRQTIEIRETANRYFERAILFVTPQGALLNEPKLKSEAEKFLEQLECPPKSGIEKRLHQKRNKKNRRIKNMIVAVFWTLAGAGIMALVQIIF